GPAGPGETTRITVAATATSAAAPSDTGPAGRLLRGAATAPMISTLRRTGPWIGLPCRDARRHTRDPSGRQLDDGRRDRDGVRCGLADLARIGDRGRVRGAPVRAPPAWRR